MAPQCPFCYPADVHVVGENKHSFAIRDQFPVSEGHTLVIPKRHVASIFSGSVAEQEAIWALVAEVRAELVQQLDPDGFTVGINDGAAAGQTIEHAHVHLVPRWSGDVPDPRGGIRWVIPAKAPYWRGE